MADSIRNGGRLRFKLGIAATHPIQYQAPWFRALDSHPDLDVHVFFGHRPSPAEQGAAGFGVAFDWDTPILEGYRYRFLRNVAAKPGLDHFFGTDTPEIAEIVRRERFDAVIVLGWHLKTSWQGIVACWRTGTPVMVRSDSHLKTQRSALKRAAKAFVYRRLIPRFDACLAVGKWSKEYFLRYGAREDRVFCVPHAVDEERLGQQFLDAQRGRTVLRQAWGLRPDSIVYLFSGRFIAKKRPFDFIRAVALAAKRVPNVQGLMVGDGPMRQECETLISELGAPIRCVGFLNQSRIVEGYVAADMLVLASDGGETWGLVANEAMFCHRPCIVSDQVGCGADLVISGVTGDSFPCGDIGALANLLVRYADGNRLEIMGEHARRRVERYSIHEATTGTLRALAAVTNANGVNLAPSFTGSSFRE
jgi:glycosyltransferase involved in cell wall biosynthesis